MSVVTREDLLKQLKWRYATKKFDSSRKISDADWKALEEALVLTPSSFGLQPWKFFVVVDPATKAKLPPASWGQMQVQEASHVVVIAVRKEITEDYVDKYMARIAEIRGTSNDALKKMILGYASKQTKESVANWNSYQAYIALGNLMTSAALLGIDTCPMEGFIPEKYDEILGIGEQGYRSVVVCPLGYRAADDKYASIAKVRFPAANVVQYI
jgi:nitroreductase